MIDNCFEEREQKSERFLLGCIIVGKNKAVGKVLESKLTYNKLFPILEKAYKEGKINITIQ